MVRLCLCGETNMFTTSLLLLLLVCSTKATHFYGTVMTYYPKNTNASGAVTVVLRYKLSFHSCAHSDSWTCLSGNCGTESLLLLKEVEEESSGEWCQREGIMTRQLPSDAPFQLELTGGNWISGIVNGIVLWSAATLVELRKRSDTGQANRSPQTTVLPALRIPSNCRRDFNLLAFDPDGDEVKCRYGVRTQSECNPCTPPAVLSLSSSCSLSFSPTGRRNQGPYAVQLVMEDFPRQTITLTQINGSQEVKTTNDSISKLPVQFVLRVDAAVPSCTDGLYLPRFLPPTPANGARLHTPVNQTLQISIGAEANNSMISELLFSGPHDINRTTSAAGQYVLRWTPSESRAGENHPVCFVVQAVSNSNKYHSELRCLIVSVGNETLTTTTTTQTTPTNISNPNPTTSTNAGPSTTTPEVTTTAGHTPPVTAVSNQIVAALRVKISSSSPLSEDDVRTTVIQQIREELVRQGLPSDVTLHLASSKQLESTTTATPAVST